MFSASYDERDSDFLDVLMTVVKAVQTVMGKEVSHARASYPVSRDQCE